MMRKADGHAQGFRYWTISGSITLTASITRGCKKYTIQWCLETRKGGLVTSKNLTKKEVRRILKTMPL